MAIELSQLMLNLDGLRCAGSFLRHAVDMHSLCEYYDYGDCSYRIETECPACPTACMTFQMSADLFP